MARVMGVLVSGESVLQNPRDGAGNRRRGRPYLRPPNGSSSILVMVVGMALRPGLRGMGNVAVPDRRRRDEYSW